MSSTDITRERARNVVMRQLDWLHAATGVPGGEETMRILAALADAGIRLVGSGEAVVDAERWQRVAAVAGEVDMCITEGIQVNDHIYRAWKVVRIGDLDPIAADAGEDGQG